MFFKNTIFSINCTNKNCIGGWGDTLSPPPPLPPELMYVWTIIMQKKQTNRQTDKQTTIDCMTVCSHRKLEVVWKFISIEFFSGKMFNFFLGVFVFCLQLVFTLSIRLFSVDKLRVYFMFPLITTTFLLCVFLILFISQMNLFVSQCSRIKYKYFEDFLKIIFIIQII